jgi:hypothetical protein
MRKSLPRLLPPGFFQIGLHDVEAMVITQGLEDGADILKCDDGLAEEPHLLQGDTEVVQRRPFAVAVAEASVGGQSDGVDGKKVTEVVAPGQVLVQAVRQAGGDVVGGGLGQCDGGDEVGALSVEPGQGVVTAGEPVEEGLAGQGAQVALGGFGGA